MLFELALIHRHYQPALPAFVSFPCLILTIFENKKVDF